MLQTSMNTVFSEGSFDTCRVHQLLFLDYKMEFEDSLISIIQNTTELSQDIQILRATKITICASSGLSCDYMRIRLALVFR